MKGITAIVVALATLAVLSMIFLESTDDEAADGYDEYITFEMMQYGANYADNTATLLWSNDPAKVITDVTIPETIRTESHVLTVTKLGEAKQHRWFPDPATCSITVTIPSTVVEINNLNMISPNTSYFVVDSKNPVYTSDSGIIYTRDMTTLVCGPINMVADITIPKTVTHINFGAFACSGLIGITLNNDVYIEEDAFLGSGLLRFECRGTVTTESNAFSGSSFLKDVIIGGSLVNKGNYTFSGCGIRNIDFLDGTTDMGDGMFSGCRVQTVIIPDTVKTIGKNVITSLTITKLTISKNLESIEYDSFGEYRFKNYEGEVLGKNPKNLAGFTFTASPTFINVLIREQANFEYSFYDGNKLISTSVYKESTIPELPTFEKKGYDFEGWYLDKGLTNKYSDNTPVKENLDLYAKYVEEPTPSSGISMEIIIGIIIAILLVILIIVIYKKH